MKPRVIGLLMVVSMLCAGALFMQNAGAQNKNMNKDQAGNAGKKTGKVESDKAQEAAAGATDANVKSDTASNNKGQAAPAPPDKGGEKGKGFGLGYVEVTFNNYSPWYVKCFVDGNYRGTIAPWGAMTFPTGNGATALYARADFDDGSSFRWGPRQFFYYSGYRYEWRLNS